jgi:hypothetical protein
MALGPFRVGDQPADVLDLVISRTEDDTPLSGFAAAEIQMRKPDGTVTTWTASLVQPNIVRAAWPVAPFTVAGLYRIRAKLAGGGLVTEYASWVRFWVRPA